MNNNNSFNNNNNSNNNYYNNNNNNNNNNNYYNNNNDHSEPSLDPDLDALTNLIVNNIPKSMDSNELKLIFEKYGDIESCKVVFNRKKDQMGNINNSSNSLGYGFVKYFKKDDATMAIEQLNGFEVDSKPLKVSYAQASSSQSNHANLYINRLEPHVTNTNLKELFSGFGEVVETKILTDPDTGASRCVGFVHFAQRREALKAVSLMNGATIPFQSTPIYVKFANQGASGGGGVNGSGTSNGNTQSNSFNNNNNYNGNGFNNNYNNNNSFGNSNNGNLNHNYNNNNNSFNNNGFNGNNNMYNNNNSSGSGNGYNDSNFNGTSNNNFYNNSNSNNNSNNNNNNNFYNDDYNRQFTNNNSNGNYSNNNNNINTSNMTVYPIHISNLPNSIDETYLYKLFAFGAISGVQLLNNGQAIITYLDYQSVQNAINSLNGKIISGRSLKVVCLTNSSPSSDPYNNNNNNNNNININNNNNNNVFYS